MTKEFVKSKKNKLRCCVSFYNWLNQKFTDQILFKNKKSELEYLSKAYAAGEVTVPTELEVIMQNEAEYLIRGHYDNIDGDDELSNLFNRSQGKSDKNLV